MRLNPVSDAPLIFTVPLVSAERPALVEKVFSVVAKAFKWVRSLFAFIIPVQEEKIEPLPARDILLAKRAHQIAQNAKPNPLRFLRAAISQAIAPAVLSWFQNSHKPLSGFISKKAVDAASGVIVFIANAFFPSYSDAFKQAVALVISAPAVWYAADYLGYPQKTIYYFGYIPVNFFFYGVAFNVYTLGKQILGHYQMRRDREQWRAALSQTARDPSHQEPNQISAP